MLSSVLSLTLAALPKGHLHTCTSSCGHHTGLRAWSYIAQFKVGITLRKPVQQPFQPTLPGGSVCPSPPSISPVVCTVLSGLTQPKLISSSSQVCISPVILSSHRIRSGTTNLHLSGSSLQPTYPVGISYSTFPFKYLTDAKFSLISSAVAGMHCFWSKSPVFSR